MLFFSITAIIIIILTIIILFSKLKITINNVDFCFESGIYSLKYDAEIGIYLFDLIKLIRVKVSNKNLKNNKQFNLVKELLKNRNKYHKNLFFKNVKQIIQLINIEHIDLRIIIDTPSIILTSYAVGLIWSIFPNIIRKNIEQYNSKKLNLKVITPYEQKSSLHVELKSILNIKLVHIINMLIKMGGKKYEGTSYRRLNVNCYGKH